MTCFAGIRHGFVPEKQLNAVFAHLANARHPVFWRQRLNFQISCPNPVQPMNSCEPVQKFTVSNFIGWFDLSSTYKSALYHVFHYITIFVLRYRCALRMRRACHSIMAMRGASCTSRPIRCLAHAAQASPIVALRFWFWFEHTAALCAQAALTAGDVQHVHWRQHPISRCRPA
jgi:hypothetical protein